MRSLSITRRQWLLALAGALVVTAALAIPYLLGYGLARPGMVYTGLLMNPEDSGSYFAKMLQGYDGSWLYTIPFTAETHQPAFVGGFYLALGHLARWTGFSLDAIWHLSRVVAGLFLFLAAFIFISSMVRTAAARRTAYILSILGSGLGWLLLMAGGRTWLGAFPVDFKMPEAHLFFSALTFPHVAAGSGLMLLIFWLLSRSAEGSSRPWILASLAGLALIALGVIYPYLIFLVALVISLHWLYQSGRIRRPLWRRAGHYALAFALPMPLFVYYLIVNRTNPVFRAWADQAGTPSPPWPHYLAAFGPMLLLGALAAWKRVRQEENDRDLSILWAWLAAAALLAYGPLNAQRRFVQGLQVPLAILATVGWLEVVLPALLKTPVMLRLATRPRYSTEGLGRLFTFIFLVFMSLSNIYLLADVAITAGFRQPYPFFRTQEEVAALEWLRDNTEGDDLVLASYETGNYVASRAGNPVVLGHWAETVNWEQRVEEIGHFFGPAGDLWREAFLARNSIDYLWFGPQERALGEFDPDQAAYLKPVYTGIETIIYARR